MMYMYELMKIHTVPKPITTEAESGDHIGTDGCEVSVNALHLTFAIEGTTHIIRPSHPHETDRQEWRANHGEQKPRLLTYCLARTVVVISK
jgi:hypothetical protein